MTRKEAKDLLKLAGTGITSATRPWQEPISIMSLWCVTYTAIPPFHRWMNDIEPNRVASHDGLAFAWSDFNEPLRLGWIRECDNFYVPTPLGLAVLHENLDRLLESLR